MKEWRDISGHPNHQISEDGQVRNRKTGHILKQSPDRYGYMRLSLGSTDNVYVHRVVCEAFHGEPIGARTQVNHIDCDRQNNSASNLEWCTPSENIKWGVSHGNLDPSVGLARAREVNQKPVRIAELDRTFPSVKDCADFLGTKPNRVSRCIVGERKGQRLHGYHVEHA